ncbi:alpha/beta fold hydrolase [Thalassotalea fusca]
MYNLEIISTEVAISGGKLYVRQWRPEILQSHTPILLIHDSLGCIDLWQDFPERLALELGREVIAYDRLGFGRSTVRQDHISLNFIDQEAQTVFPELCAALNLTRVLLLGHSVGGGMAIAMAGSTNNSELIDAVVTISAQAFVEDRTIAGIKQAQDFFQSEGAIAKLEKYHGDKATWVLSSWINTWLSPSFRAWNLDKHLANIRCPILAIHGEEDEYGSTDFPIHIAYKAKGYSQARILENTKHTPHKEKPTEVLALISSFLMSIGQTVESQEIVAV